VRNLDALVKAGGNSVRTWRSSKADLDKAHEKRLMVCMGLSLALPRHGADYKDTEMLYRQREKIRKEVMALKNHPALLIWGIGNEVEHHASKEYRILVWKEINRIAEMIKQIDKNHPVITVIAGLGNESSESGMKLKDIEKYCPGLDAIGINSYGGLPNVPNEIKKQGWKKPYIIPEFGPRGWWEVARTPWGLPIEDTSTQKALFYYQSYLAGIANKSNCLGSFVFLWGNKQEKTHTWFCLFLPDGSPTEMIDAMTRAWTGSWPDNRAPTVEAKGIEVISHKNEQHIYKTLEKITCKIHASDPDGDRMTIKWDLRKDVSDHPGTGGDREDRIPPIEGAIELAVNATAIINLPQEEGNYRIFIYVFDPSGKVATANLPIKVEADPK